jgi:osmotically-inducible protein OsmY
MDAQTFRRGLGMSAFVALLALGAAPARAGGQDVQQKVTDQLKKAGVEKSGEVTVDVDRDNVTLNGFVTTVAAERSALKAAQKVTPNVEDRLRVVPEVERTDAELMKDVQKGILRYTWYTVFDSVSVGVDHGLVQMEGSVLQPYRRDDIEAIVARIPGVRGIENHLTVQRVSMFDAELRQHLVNAIYRNPVLQRYALGPNPPIHIVVDGGNVTLTGVVGSPLEQTLLTHIARSSMAFKVDNQVEVEGRHPEDRKPDPATD